MHSIDSRPGPAWPAPRRCAWRACCEAPAAGLLALLLAMPATAQARPGDLDPSFGSGGKVTTDFGDASAVTYALAVQPGGRLVAAGAPDARFGSDFALARCRAD